MPRKEKVFSMLVLILKKQGANAGTKGETMPEVNGIHFPYNKEGRRAAKKARKKASRKNYSSEALAMAKMMSDKHA